VRTKELSQREVEKRIRGLDPDNQKAVVCALIGHSRIQEYCFGYFTCARCGAHLGDSLGGCYPAAEAVGLVGHACDTCRENAKSLTWRDTFMTPDPEINGGTEIHS